MHITLKECYILRVIKGYKLYPFYPWFQDEGIILSLPSWTFLLLIKIIVSVYQAHAVCQHGAKLYTMLCFVLTVEMAR